MKVETEFAVGQWVWNDALKSCAVVVGFDEEDNLLVRYETFGMGAYGTTLADGQTYTFGRTHARRMEDAPFYITNLLAAWDEAIEEQRLMYVAATDGVWLNSVRTEEREVDNYKSEVETKLIRNVLKGEFIRFTANGPVYVRDDYDRESKTFSCYKFSDVNSFRNVKGDKSVFVGFTF